MEKASSMILRFFCFFEHVGGNFTFDDVFTVVAFEDVALHFDKVDDARWSSRPTAAASQLSCG